MVEIPIFCSVHQSTNPGSITLASCTAEVGCSTAMRCKELRAVLAPVQLRGADVGNPNAVSHLFSARSVGCNPLVHLFNTYRFCKVLVSAGDQQVWWGTVLCLRCVEVTFFLVICFITSKCSQTDQMIPCWVTETFINDIWFLSVKGSKVQECHSL